MNPAMRLWNYLACRLRHPRDYWHNRHFDTRYRATEGEPGHWAVSWRNVPVRCRPLPELVRQPHPPVCHIFASGPSLAALREPARLFKDFTICLNGSYRVAEQAGQPCDLFVTFDAGFIRRRFEDFKRARPWARTVVIDHLVFFLTLSQDASLGRSLNPFLYNDANRPYLGRAVEKARQLQTHFRSGQDYVSDGREAGGIISRSAQIGLASNASVVCLALQVAWLMGFREVRIYGMDLGGPARFYSEAARTEPTKLDESYESHLLPWFRSFAANFCGPAFRVFNCSATSRLPADILPRLDPNAPVA